MFVVSEPTFTESPTGVHRIDLLVPFAGVAAAAVLIFSAYFVHNLSAYAFALAGLVLAWGWPILLELPRPPESAVVLATSAVAMTAIVVFSASTDGMKTLSVVLAIAMVLTFLYEYIRTDSRVNLVSSIASTSFGLAVLASGTFYAGAAAHRYGDAVVAAAAGAVALGLLIDAALSCGSAAEWSLPASLLVGALLGLVLGLATDVRWNILLLAGFLAAAIGFAVRRVLGIAIPTDTWARLASGMTTVLSAGPVAYAAEWLINR